jgi:anti-sigma B factor antagonist
MEIKQDQVGAITVLTPVGRLDTDSAIDFELALQDLQSAGTRHFVIDCAELGYISSAGLRVLTALIKQLEASRGSLRLAGMSAAVRQVFEIAGMSKMFSIHADRGAALAGHPHAAAAAPAPPAPAPKAPVAAAAAPAAGSAAAAPPPAAAPAATLAKPDIGRLAAKLLGASEGRRPADAKRAGMAKVASDLLADAPPGDANKAGKDAKAPKRK